MSLLSVPPKAIFGYHARTVSEALPDSYSACDGITLVAGNHGLTPNDGGSGYTKPDLRNRYIIGADLTRVTTPTSVGDAVGNAPSINERGGLNWITLAVANLPAHGHTTTTAQGGQHTHAIPVSFSGFHSHPGVSYSISAAVVNLGRSAAQYHQADTASTVTAASPGGWDNHTHTGGSVTNDTVTHAAAHSIGLTTARSSGGTAAGGQSYDARPRSHSTVWVIKVF